MKMAILSRKPSLYSTRRLQEEASERGHEVSVLNHMKCYSVIEPDHPSLHHAEKDITDIEAIIPRIGASVTFYGTSVVRQFEMMHVFTVNSSDAILRSRDKLRSLQILSRADVNLPKTVFASKSKDVEGLIDHVGTPCVIKMLESTQGMGVVLAESHQAARSVIEAFYGLNARIILQEFIAESGGSDIRAFVVDGEVIGAMKRRGKKGEFRSNIHRGGTAELVDLEPHFARTALRAAGAHGLNVAGVDLIESARGPLVLEVNSSPGLEGIEKATNKNIAGQIIEFIETERPAQSSAAL